MLSLDVTPGIGFESEVFHNLLLRTKKSHRQKDQLTGQNTQRPLRLNRGESPGFIFPPGDVHHLDTRHIAIIVLDETLGHDEIPAGFLPLQGLRLHLAIVEGINLGPLRPGVIRSTLHWRHGHDFKLDDAFALLTKTRPHTVCSGITPTNDNHIFPGRIEFFRIGSIEIVIKLVTGISGEKIHGHMDTVRFPVVDRQISPLGGPTAEDRGIEIPGQSLLRPLRVLPYIGARHKLNSFFTHEIDPAVNDLPLIKFHVGNPIHEQSSNPIGPLKHGNLMTREVKLIRTGKPCRTRTNHCNLLACSPGRNLGGKPSFFPTPVDNRALDILDRDGRFYVAEHTGSFAGSRADTSGEFREIIGFPQTLKCFLPAITIHEIIKLRDEIVNRATAGHAGNKKPRMAVWSPAIHTARTLLHHFLVRAMSMNFLPVLDALKRRAIGNGFPFGI